MAKGRVKQAQVKIIQNEFELLCRFQCSREEVCDYFGVSKDTLIRWCKETYGTDYETIFKQKKEQGKMSLRSAMFQNAIHGGKYGKGETSVQIFMAKNWLGMSDHAEAKNEDPVQIIGDLDED